MKTRGGLVALLSVAAVSAGCAKEPGQPSGPRSSGSDGGVDTVCPDYPDGGTVQLMRGCPLTIEYRIQ